MLPDNGERICAHNLLCAAPLRLQCPRKRHAPRCHAARVSITTSFVSKLRRPGAIAEVLSPTTERYDRGKKWAHYQRLPSLQTYLLVAQDEIRVEVFRRSPAGWLYTSHADPTDVITLAEPPCTLALTDIYRGLLDHLPRA